MKQLSAPDALRAEAVVKEVSGLISAAYPRVTKITADLWAESLLRRCPDRGLCRLAILRAAETLDQLSLHRLHRALDDVRKPKACDDSRALPAHATLTEEQAKQQAARARAIAADIAARLGRKKGAG